MARNKFEQDFGKKLKNREITPSADSWDKLENRLNASVEKKSGRRFRWGGIAASLAGGLIILSVAFNSDRIWNAEEIADTPSEEMIIEEKQPFEHPEMFSEDKSKVAQEERIAVNEKEVVEKPSGRNSEVAAIAKETTKRARKELNVEKRPVLVQKAEAPLQQEQILAMTSSRIIENETITEAEVDELLRRAATEISRENSMVNNQSTDAGSLLFEVEMELERSFRDKVFEVLKESYLKTRTAVANRSL